MSNILSREFKYVPSVRTDIRKTFERARQQLAQQAQAKKHQPAPYQEPARQAARKAQKEAA